MFQKTFRTEIMFHKTFTIPTCLLFLSLAGCSNFAGPTSGDIPTTHFGFQLSEPAHVRVWVENNYQTEVVSALDELRQAGSHSVMIEMKDADGKRLPYGLYTIFIKTDSFASSHPILFTK